MTDKKVDFVVKSKEEAYWDQEIRLGMMQIDSIKKEMENGLKMIELIENSIEFCKKKIAELKK